MAIASQGWKLTAKWVDTAGDSTTRSYDLVPTDTAGDATAVFAAVSTVLAALVAATDAKLASYNVSKVLVEDALTLPAGDVNIENNLQVSAKIDGIPNKSGVFEIPAPKDTLFINTTGPGHNIADFTDGLLAAVVNLYDSTGELFLSDGEHIDAASGIKGKRVHHKSTRG